jgi:hypothetical protein
MLAPSVVLYGCETWSVTLREGSVFENRVPCRTFGTKRDEVTGEWSCTMRSFVICTHPKISLGSSSWGEWSEWGMWHAWERRRKCTGFWWDNQKERDHLKDQGVDGRMGSEWILQFRETGWGGVEWIRLAQDRDRWRAVVNAVMNLRVLAPRS